MKKIINLVITATLIIVGLSAGVVPAYAEGEEDEQTPETWLQLSPTAGVVTLRGGDVISGDSEECPEDMEEGCVVKVTNIGSQPFTYRIYASPYAVQEDGNVEFSEDSATSYTQISRWISFLDDSGKYQKEVVHSINPGESQTIAYRIDVPEDVPGGAQYAVIWAQTVGSGNTSGSTGVQTISQAGMVVSGRSIGDTRQTAEITSYDFTRFTFGGSLTAEAKVKNTGNTDFDAYYTYTATTLFGKELYKDSGSVAAFPDSEHTINVNWDSTPFLGIFRVQFRVSAADTVTDESHIVVIMPVFIMILLILLLTVIIVWIIIIIRKRKERKARTLV